MFVIGKPPKVESYEWYETFCWICRRNGYHCNFSIEGIPLMFCCHLCLCRVFLEGLFSKPIRLAQISCIYFAYDFFLFNDLTELLSYVKENVEGLLFLSSNIWNGRAPVCSLEKKRKTWWIDDLHFLNLVCKLDNINDILLPWCDDVLLLKVLLHLYMEKQSHAYIKCTFVKFKSNEL